MGRADKGETAGKTKVHRSLKTVGRKNTMLRDNTVRVMTSLRAQGVAMKLLVAAGGAPKSATYSRMRLLVNLPSTPTRSQGRPPLLSDIQLRDHARWWAENPYSIVEDHAARIINTYNIPSLSDTYTRRFMKDHPLEKRTIFGGPEHAEVAESAVLEALYAVASALLKIRDDETKNVKIVIVADKTKAEQNPQMKRLVKGNIDARMYEITLERLKDTNNERLWLNMNVKLGKLYLDISEFGQLHRLLGKLYVYCQTPENDNDQSKATALLDVYLLDIIASYLSPLLMTARACCALSSR